MKAKPPANPSDPAKPSRPSPGQAAPKADRLDPLEWIDATQAQPDILQAMERQKKGRRRRRLKTMVGIASMLVFAALAWNFRAPLFPLPSATPDTATVHVPAHQVLPDGSLVELKDGARIREAFTADLRRVELLGGEAHFTVTKNPARPFVVAAGGVEFRAVGTAFSVDLRHREVEMIVTEGVVAVEATATNVERSTLNAERPSGDSEEEAAQPVLVGAGKRVVVDLMPEAGQSAPPVETLEAGVMREKLAWRVPRLEFSGTPLDQAIPMINEHSQVKLVLGDPDLGNVRLSGILRADNIDALRELLAEVHGIRSEYRTSTEIVLSRKK